MPTRMFTQSAAVLLQKSVDASAIASQLSEFKIARTIEGGGEIPWMGGAPGLLLAMRPEVNGYVVVDVLDAPWPDDMGDPKQESHLFGAWSMGWFGPHTFPGCLSRAQAMSFAWEDAPKAVADHSAFIRIKSSYALGASDDTRLVPEDYEPLGELEFVTKVARALLNLPEALAYFNPNGEVLRDIGSLDKDLKWHRDHNLLPLPVWSNVRLFRATPEWSVMDTLGMDQLDIDDHEACFRTKHYTLQDVGNFLRNATEYVRKNGPIIKDGNTMDGPGGIRWIAGTFETSLAQRPRRVLRWVPLDGARLPDELRK